MSQAEVPLEQIHVFYGKWVRSKSNWFEDKSARMLHE